MLQAQLTAWQCLRPHYKVTLKAGTYQLRSPGSSSFCRDGALFSSANRAPPSPLPPSSPTWQDRPGPRGRAYSPECPSECRCGSCKPAALERPPTSASLQQRKHPAVSLWEKIKVLSLSNFLPVIIKTHYTGASSALATRGPRILQPAMEFMLAGELWALKSSKLPRLRNIALILYGWKQIYCPKSSWTEFRNNLLL